METARSDTAPPRTLFNAVKQTFRRAMRTVRYAAEALAILPFYLCFLCLGIDRSSALGGVIGRSLGPWSRGARVARINLRTSMPELSESDLERLLGEMWENLGRVFGELPHLAGITGENFLRRVTIEGLSLIHI